MGWGLLQCPLVYCTAHWNCIQHLSMAKCQIKIETYSQMCIFFINTHTFQLLHCANSPENIDYKASNTNKKEMHGNKAYLNQHTCSPDVFALIISRFALSTVATSLNFKNKTVNIIVHFAFPLKARNCNKRTGLCKRETFFYTSVLLKGDGIIVHGFPQGTRVKWAFLQEEGKLKSYRLLYVGWATGCICIPSILNYYKLMQC